MQNQDPNIQTPAILSSNSESAELTTKSKKKNVIIIGAGFAGLSTAYHLQKHNQQSDNDNDQVDFVIVEGRDRVGGRVHPHNLDGTIVDMGGQWVHEASKRNPIRQLLQHDLKIPFYRPKGKEAKKRSASQPVVFTKDGKEINKHAQKKASKFWYKTMEDYDETKIDIHTSMKDLLDEALQKRAASSTQNDKNSNEFHQLINYFAAQMEMYEGGRLHELSVHLDELYLTLKGPDDTPQGGYDTVLKALVKKIGLDKIRLGNAVKSLQYDDSNSEGGNVVVTLENDEQIEGDYCVCTVPLGVLQHRRLTFLPALPQDRWEAIDSIGMGLLDKVVMKFDRRFWGKYTEFRVASDDQVRVKDFLDITDEVGGCPVLIMFHGGNAARRVDSPNGLSDEEAVEESMDSLRQLFGKDIPNPIAYHVTRWQLDPFAYGSYSFAKVGCTEDMYDKVASPEGNLLFAGEHTSKRMHSTVHGAWATGAREASRITAWLK